MSDRELTMDDYLAMLRRRLKVILIPALIAPLGGFLISYAPFFPPKYSSQATVLVEGQKVPDTLVTPVITSDFAQRVQSLSQKILTPSLLRPLIDSLNLGLKPEEERKLIAGIGQNMTVDPVMTLMSAAVANSPTAKTKKPSASNEPVPGFNVGYSDSDPVRAQKICNALTSLMVDQNLKSRSEVAQSTTDFLGRQVEDAKHNVNDLNAQLADFKQKHQGELPTDVENNMRILASLNTQLEASTQTLTRAQQDKAFTESMLAQQIAAWKSSLSSDNPQTVEQQLNQQRALLMQLQARYTDDYPDVIKAKISIADLEKKLKEVNAANASSAASATTDSSDKVSAGANSEPPEIRQLRVQIHQFQGVIQQATVDQKKLQTAITQYEHRAATSPSVEEDYRKLTSANDSAQALLNSLLAKKSTADLGTNMENAQEGEQMNIVALAGLPDSPSFPVRPLFAAAGLGVGLGLGALIAIILEFSDKSIRTERDAAAIMDLPLLISVPWLGEEEEDEAAGGGNERRRFWGRGDSVPPKDREHVEV